MDHPRKGFRITLPEIVIGLFVLLMLVIMSLPLVPSEGFWSASTQMLSRMKQLHLAAQQMALDGTTTGDKTLSWPGTNTYHSWITNLLPSYLGTNDFQKLMAPPVPPHQGMAKTLQRWWAGPTASLTENTNAILVYGVSEESDSNVIFLSSANFLNTPGGGILRTNGDPLKGKAFVVFHKGGDGAVLLLKQAGHTNEVGAFAPLCR